MGYRYGGQEKGKWETRCDASHFLTQFSEGTHLIDFDRAFSWDSKVPSRVCFIHLSCRVTTQPSIHWIHQKQAKWFPTGRIGGGFLLHPQSINCQPCQGKYYRLPATSNSKKTYILVVDKNLIVWWDELGCWAFQETISSVIPKRALKAIFRRISIPRSRCHLTSKAHRRTKSTRWLDADHPMAPLIESF